MGRSSVSQVQTRSAIHSPATLGLPGAYVAWLSTADVDAVDRLGNARGWIRPDGLPFVDTIDELVAGRTLYPPFIDETNLRGHEEVWTGTAATGRHAPSAGDCQGWTSNDASDEGLAGLASGASSAFTDDTLRIPLKECSRSKAILCFGTDNRSRVSLAPQNGRVAFITRGTLAGGGGTSSFDSLCDSEAQAAGLGGTFVASVADASFGGIVARHDLVGPPWIRPDGLLLVHQAADLFDARQLACTDIPDGRRHGSVVSPQCGLVPVGGMV